MEDIIDNFHTKAESYPLATKGQRFTNCIIDYICCFLFSIALYAFIALGIGEDNFLFMEHENIIIQKLIDWFQGLVILSIYYTFFEHFFKGKTPGKYITKTRAVRVDDGVMNISITFKRSLCRSIPFEPFSFLGDKPTGWHDSLTDTRVIVDKDWVNPNDELIF